MKEYKHQEYLQRLLQFDGFGYAESLLGTDPEVDPISGAVGLILETQSNATKNQILQLNNDSFLECNPNYYKNVAKALGFSVVLEYPFNGHNGEDLTNEYLYVMWNEDFGILLKFDTFNFSTETMQCSQKATVKSSTFYYNWKPKDGKYVEGIMADGHFCGDTWIGDHDGREALKLKLKLLAESGKFIFPWVKKPEINFCHYADKGDKDKVNKERIKLLHERKLDFV